MRLKLGLDGFLQHGLKNGKIKIQQQCHGRLYGSDGYINLKWHHNIHGS